MLEIFTFQLFTEKRKMCQPPVQRKRNRAVEEENGYGRGYREQRQMK